MKVPTKMNTYCPHCKKHGEHKVKSIVQKHSPAKPRTMAWGQAKHVKKTKGYKSKVAGSAAHDKQSARNVLYLECNTCKKRHPMTIGRRTKKKAEKKKE